jgi:hypothetical protein
MKDKPISILDPEFKYTSAAKTDITKTFAKARKELKISSSNQESKEPLVTRNVWGLPEILPLKHRG